MIEIPSVTTHEHGRIRVSDDSAVLVGDFRRYGRNCAYGVIRALDPSDPRGLDNDGTQAALNVLPAVIGSVVAGPAPVRYDVRDGDVIEVDGERYRIADDRPGHAPRLILIDPTEIGDDSQAPRRTWAVDRAVRQAAVDAASRLDAEAARLADQWGEMSSQWQRSARGRDVASWIREVEDLAATIRQSCEALARPDSNAVK